ncbi:MAG: dockerin type I domain-containing protein, partial [Planctomycetota bacterium]|nr:dockerin type I domain-containing protein [Planctomycetota bacterium]
MKNQTPVKQLLKTFLLGSLITSLTSFPVLAGENQNLNTETPQTFPSRKVNRSSVQPQHTQSYWMEIMRAAQQATTHHVADSSPSTPNTQLSWYDAGAPLMSGGNGGGSASDDPFHYAGSGHYEYLTGNSQHGVLADLDLELHQNAVPGGCEGYILAAADIDSRIGGTTRNALDGYIRGSYGWGGENGNFFAYGGVLSEAVIGDSWNVTLMDELMDFETGVPEPFTVCSQSWDLWNWSSTFTVWIIPVTVGFDLDFNVVGRLVVTVSPWNAAGELEVEADPSLDSSFTGSATAGIGGSLNSLLAGIFGQTIANFITEHGVNVNAEAGVGFEYTPILSIAAECYASRLRIEADLYLDTSTTMRLFLYVQASVFINLPWPLPDVTASASAEETLFYEILTETRYPMHSFEHVFPEEEGGVFGDLNGDNCPDILDVILLTGALMNGTADQLGSAADLNGDGSVDVLDIVFLKNMIIQ